MKKNEIPSSAAEVGNSVELLPSHKFWLVDKVYGEKSKDSLGFQRAGANTLESIKR